MRTLSCLFLLIPFFLLTMIPVARCGEEIAPSGSDKIEFDLSYRGLSGEKDTLRYGARWGFGKVETETSLFTQSLNIEEKTVHHVHNFYLKGAEYSAVAFEGEKAVAFYFDLDMNGRFSEEERIEPIQNHSGDQEFVTPDFTLLNRNGIKVPYRVLLQVDFYEPDEPNFMWSPSCVWEGEADLDGRRLLVTLFDRNFNGSFQDAGGDTIALRFKDQSQNETHDLPSVTLSRIFAVENKFYRLAFEGNEVNGSDFRLILEKDTTPVGLLKVQLAGEGTVESESSNWRFRGAMDESVVFDLSGTEWKIPEGAYKLERSYLYYASGKGERWQTTVSLDTAFDLKAEKECTLELGDPHPTVTAIEESKRYAYEKKFKTSFPAGEDIFLSRKIKGKHGEIFGGFYRFNERRQEPVEPQFRILDDQGAEVASGTMKYG